MTYDPITHLQETHAAHGRSAALKRLINWLLRKREPELQSFMKRPEDR